MISSASQRGLSSTVILSVIDEFVLILYAEKAGKILHISASKRRTSLDVKSGTFSFIRSYTGRDF